MPPLIDSSEQHRLLKAHAVLTELRDCLTEEEIEALGSPLGLIRATLMEGTDKRLSEIASDPSNPYYGEGQAWIKRTRADLYVGPLINTEFVAAIAQYQGTTWDDLTNDGVFDDDDDGDEIG